MNLKHCAWFQVNTIDTNITIHVYKYNTIQKYDTVLYKIVYCLDQTEINENKQKKIEELWSLKQFTKAVC